MRQQSTVRRLKRDNYRTLSVSSPKSSISANISLLMPITIEMPKLSDTMTEGTLVRWIKKVGDNVAVGDVLAEVETDKATMEMEAFDEGVLAEIYVQDGNKAEVGQKLALLVGKGEKVESGEPKPGQESKSTPQKKGEKEAVAPPK